MQGVRGRLVEKILVRYPAQRGQRGLTLVLRRATGHRRTVLPAWGRTSRRTRPRSCPVRFQVVLRPGRGGPGRGGPRRRYSSCWALGAGPVAVSAEVHGAQLRGGLAEDVAFMERSHKDDHVNSRLMSSRVEMPGSWLGRREEGHIGFAPLTSSDISNRRKRPRTALGRLVSIIAPRNPLICRTIRHNMDYRAEH
jgi:hypothetical protein